MQAGFKVAENSDIDLLTTFVQDFYEYDGHHFDEGVVRTTLVEFLNDKTLGQTWLILADSTPIGYMILTLGYSLNHPGREAFVDEVFIQESHRRYGLGRQAFAFIEVWCRATGVKALHLEVEQENTQALAFYRTIGFEDHDEYLMSCWLEDNPAEINLRLADYSDLDILISLMQEQQRFTSEAKSRAALVELLGNDSLGKVWLIQMETRPVGYLVLTYSYSLEFHGRDAFIDQLYLREGDLQPELETQAIRFAQKASRVLGVKALHIVMKRKDIKTQALYRAAGFEDDDSYLMTKRITKA